MINQRSLFEWSHCWGFTDSSSLLEFMFSLRLSFWSPSLLFCCLFYLFLVVHHHEQLVLVFFFFFFISLIIVLVLPIKKKKKKKKRNIVIKKNKKSELVCCVGIMWETLDHLLLCCEVAYALWSKLVGI